MLNHLYNWLFRDTTANQIRDLQLDKSDLVELETDIDFDKLKKVQSVKKPFLVSGGYLKDCETWTLVFTLPSIYHFNRHILKQYILTNFNISHLNYRNLKLSIDDQIIIDDTSHPWKESWKSHLQKGKTNCSIPYLTFPIQEINYQSIRFELTYDKSVVEDPKDVFISFDIQLFKDRKDELDFFNAWKVKKFSCLSPRSHIVTSYGVVHGRDDWFLPVNQIFYEIILKVKKDSEYNEFPLKTIQLTDHDGDKHQLCLHDYEEVDDFYRLTLTNNYIDGLSSFDWKSIEMIPKIGYREKIDKIHLFTSSKLQFKNNRLLSPVKKSLRF